METVRQNNKEKQLSIINDLIATKTNLIAKHLGNLSLEDAKRIIEEEYLNVKSKLNILNSDITTANNNIKTKKITIKNFLMEKDTLIQKEKLILDRELQRIENKRSDEVDKLNDNLSSLNEDLHTLLNTERVLEKEIKESEAFIKTFKYNRARLRDLHIKQINNQHLEHKQRQKIKKELQFQILQLEQENRNITTEINNYDQDKYNINKDYYNWKNDIKLTDNLLSSLQKEIISECELHFQQTDNNLNDYKNSKVWDANMINELINIILVNIDVLSDEGKLLFDKIERISQLSIVYQNLEKDTRQDTTTRYNQLEIKRKKLLKKNTKITKIINKFKSELQKTEIFRKIKINAPDLNENEDQYDKVQQELLVAKENTSIINNKIKDYQNKILDLEQKISLLSKDELSETLSDAKTRCLSRWEKINDRYNKKYDTECNSISEDINLLFKNISEKQKELTQLECYWTDINKDPGIILLNFHNNTNNTNNTNNINNTNNVNNVTLEMSNNIVNNTTSMDSNSDHINSIKDDIMEIINMKRTISRIQTNR